MQNTYCTQSSKNAYYDDLFVQISSMKLSSIDFL